MQDAAVSAAAEATSPKHALQITVRLTVAAWEASTSKDTWRSYGTETTTALARWGYQLSDIEQAMINSHDGAAPGRRAQGTTKRTRVGRTRPTQPGSEPASSPLPPD